ncbi:ribonuclease P protein component [uncultured Ruminobacter sp.]|jgi:ribonuclease P protein component|uniref:ribonuclease P protein component n=1 Tax=uncultured Ruminobacter sp. TaxID=538947 RepID=UPI0025DAD87D|nr:ribonuclease P protein component [uncultured Ruminobacter sp.]
MTKENFPREFRLLTPENFNNVFKDPIRAGSPYITILAKNSDLNFPRLGMIVPKKALKRAVWRNRAKRLIRESFRTSYSELENLDYVCIIKPDFLKIDNQEFSKLLKKLWKTISIRSRK